MGTATVTKRVCRECGTKLLGRADKQFCSDMCRNAHHNRENSDANNLVRQINNALRKNRRILAGLTASKDVTKVNRDTLIRLGFDFEYFTHQYRTKKGHVYNFCYEQGYLALEDNWYAVVKRKRYEAGEEHIDSSS